MLDISDNVLKYVVHISVLENLETLIFTYQSLILKGNWGTSLVAQWLRIRLPMQGTWVRALVWEDPTCRGATKPVHHNY